MAVETNMNPSTVDPVTNLPQSTMAPVVPGGISLPAMSNIYSSPPQPMATVGVPTFEPNNTLINPVTGNPPTKSPLGLRSLRRSLLMAGLAVALTAAAVGLMLTTRQGQNSQSAKLADRVPPQAVQMTSQPSSPLPVVLDNAADTLVVNGDVFVNGKVRFYDGQYYFNFQPANFSANRIYQLPDASGTVCLDTNNCDYATTAQLQASSGGFIEAVTAGNGISGGGTAGSVNLDLTSANGGIVVNTDNIALTVSTPGDGLSSTTSSGPGLEILSSGLTLLQGCSDGQILKWNEATDVWACSSDTVGGVSDGDKGDITVTASGATWTIDPDSVALGSDTTGSYVASFTAGSGLTGDATGEGSTPTIAVASANGGIVVNTNDIALTLTTTGTDGVTSSGSGLEILAGGLTLLKGCNNDETLKWNNTTDVWTCASDVFTGDTLDTVYINDSDKQMNVNNAAGLTFDLTTTGDFIIEDGGTPVVTINDSGQALFQNAANSTTAFQIQNAAGSSNLFIADTTNTVIKIGTSGSATQAGTELFVVDAEVSGALRVGDGTNNAQFDGTTHELTFSGTARHTRRINLVPEYPGAVMTADGGDNSGTMSSDFCSGTSRRSINTTVCAATDEHNYYTWTASATNKDYDIYILYQIPSDFSAFASDTTINMYGWRTDGTTNTVDLALFQANGTQCGSTTNVATGTATWTETALTGSETGCTVAAGDIVLWRIHLDATAGDYSRAGEIRFDYLSKW